MIELSFPTRKLKGLIKRVNIKFKNSNDFNNREIIVYGVTNKEGITITGNNTSEDLSNYLVLKENQFAYNPYRINVGSLGLSKKSTLGLISPAYVIFETKDGLDAEFLLYYLKSNLGLNLIKWYGDRGGVRSALRYTDLENIDIPDLNIEQQRNVLKKLKLVELQLKEFDMSCERQLNYLKSLKDTILQDAVQGKLVEQNPNDEPAEALLEKIKEEKERLIKANKIKKEKSLPEISEEEIPYKLPETWVWTRLGVITDYGYNASVNEKDVENNTWVLELEDIEKDTSKLLKKLTFNERKFKSTKLKFEKDDVLYCKLRPYLNKVIVANDNGICSSEIMPIKGYYHIYPKYLMYMLKRREFIQHVNSLTYGTKMPRLRTDDARRSLIPLAPYDEQKRIVEKVDSLISLCDELEKKIEEQKEYSNKLMESIIKSSLS